MGSLAIIAAFPREVAFLVQGWQRHSSKPNVTLWSRGSVCVACAGMGPGPVTRAVHAAMSLQPIATLFSVGLAGSCDPAVRPGSLVRVGQVIDATSGERFGAAMPLTTLVSSSVLASVAEKRRLHTSYGASAVDMEAATVARLARAHNLEFCAIKAISDAYDFEIAELGRFSTVDGQFRDAAFALHVMLRPMLWRRLFVLAGDSKRAISMLTDDLVTLLKVHQQTTLEAAS